MDIRVQIFETVCVTTLNNDENYGLFERIIGTFGEELQNRIIGKKLAY